MNQPSPGMTLTEKNGVQYCAVDFLERTGLARAVFTTRVGGVSQGVSRSMNFSFKRPDTPQNVRENYRRLCAAAGFDPARLAGTIQTHGTHVHEPDQTDLCGIFDDQGQNEADALITRDRLFVLVKHFADCVPVYILDTQTPAIGLVHAGWRGTLSRVAQRTLQTMQTRYGTQADHCLCFIGPCIARCCFEVGRDVADAFSGEFPGVPLVDEGFARPHVDVTLCNRAQLLECGVPGPSIGEAGLCTHCHAELFYSHRRDAGQTGSMAAFMQLL